MREDTVKLATQRGRVNVPDAIIGRVGLIVSPHSRHDTDAITHNGRNGGVVAITGVVMPHALRNKEDALLVVVCVIDDGILLSAKIKEEKSKE